MNTATIFSHAKVNLFLDIQDRRSDGYHNLVMVNAKLSLHDTITCEWRDGHQISLLCDDPALPTDDRNLAVRATQRFFEQTKKHKSITIRLEKRIPIGAGLGGGSSNAASMLILLNELFRFPLSKEELKGIAAGIGADVPFFLESGCCFVTGIGDNVISVSVHAIAKWKPIYTVLCTPSETVSTKDAYALWDQTDNNINQTPSSLLNALIEGDFHAIPDRMFNAFEQVIYPAYDGIRSAYETFCAVSPTRPLLSGSGSNLFSLHMKKTEATQVASKLNKKGYTTFIGELML
ncbi:MAG: 4-(cytidine 5'-diphospho)-2-C-methyl-D-erythritol kinase [Candidatus Omnitrophota bacterium]|jgi:4-diphosphocytidyl-2-C-methyl-D-erythritol kinase|nr:MAG: 4-(cytidine 5'-diphospho)-2-C-methyl-D-erythritol kinase [Candidatus Omnitrophota bacterium]